MFDSFQTMFEYYIRRNIFTAHDSELVSQGVIEDGDGFIDKILTPKMFQGRLNYGDFIRILAVL